MKGKNRNQIFLALRCIVAGIFIFAGFQKLLQPDVFAEHIDNYRMLPYLLVALLAIVLPWLELLAGGLLLFGSWKRGAAFILLLLSGMFVIAIGSAMVRGLDISCGCFSMSDEAARVGLVRLIEDLILFALIIVLNLRLAKES